MQINIYISPTSGEIEYRFLSLSSLLCLNLSFFNSYYTRVQLKKKKKKLNVSFVRNSLATLRFQFQSK